MGDYEREVENHRPVVIVPTAEELADPKLLHDRLIDAELRQITDR